MAATRRYRERQDPIARFLSDCTVKAPGKRVSASTLWARYGAWCLANAVSPATRTTFGLQLEQHGLRKIRSNGYQYLNISLLP
ncbi:MAG: primase-like DNA-binding domain-containing protein [Planctomycetota bacterium]